MTGRDQEVSQRESKEISVETNWKKAALAGILTLVIVGLALLVGPNTWNSLIEQRRLSQSPQFTFAFSGVADEAWPVYEITPDMLRATQPFGRFDVTVSGDYRGRDYAHPVDVAIRPAAGDPIPFGRWENFRDDRTTPQRLTLSEKTLFEYSNTPSDPSVVGLSGEVTGTLSLGQFDIEVTAQDETRLASKTVEVVNTPWSHAVQLSDSLIGTTQVITAYVTVRNIGMPAEFYVVGNLYDTTSVPTETLEQGQDGWSPAKSWGQPKINFTEPSPGTVQSGAEFTVQFAIAGGQLSDRHTFLLETFAVKHIPELQFPEGDWRTSPEGWRVRDNPTYMMIIVPAGMT